MYFYKLKSLELLSNNLGKSACKQVEQKHDAGLLMADKISETRGS